MIKARMTDSEVAFLGREGATSPLITR